MPIYRTAMEIERLKRRIENHIHQYAPDARVVYRYASSDPWMNYETIAQFDVIKKQLIIDERVLISWPEEEIWRVVNHELAHFLSVPELKERYRPLFPNLTQREWHNSDWVTLSRVLGGDETSYSRAASYPMRFRMRCTTCGLTFYSNGVRKSTLRNGVFELLDRYNGEPANHPTNHKTFYVEDIITRRRQIVPRDVPDIAQWLYKLW